MQIIYRVIIKIKNNRAFFEFNNIEQACKFADAAKVTNADVNGKYGKARVSIELICPDEVEEDD